MVRQTVISLSSFSDEMQKIAKLSEKEKRVAEGAGGGALILGGGALITSPGTKGRLLGYKRVYHGTSPEVARSIKEKGLLTRFGGTGQAGIDKKVAGREIAGEVSKGKVYVTPMKPHARVYAAAAGLRKDIGEEGVKRLIEEGPTSENVAAVLRHSQPFSKAQRGGMLTVDLPMDMWDKMVPDPLIKKLHGKNLPDVVQPFIPQGREMAAIGDFEIDPRYIHGTGGASRRTRELLKKLPGYMKKHPGRFGLGALAAATGLGAIGGGGALIHRAFTKGKERSK